MRLIMKFLDLNILNCLQSFSIYLAPQKFKGIILTSTILVILILPILLSGPLKKGLEYLGKIINGFAMGGSAYLDGKVILKDLRSIIRYSGSREYWRWGKPDYKKKGEISPNNGVLIALTIVVEKLAINKGNASKTLLLL